MNEKRLKIYLEDHLALMVGEIELIGRCQRSNRGTPLGEFLDQLENEVSAQKSIVSDLIHRIGSREGIPSKVKQMGAWILEKAGRLKLNDSLVRYSDLSRVVELETLAALAQERISLWDNFDTFAREDERLQSITFSYFRDQAGQHLNTLNARRRFAAAQAFATND